jgi:hypothetical protein
MTAYLLTNHLLNFMAPAAFVALMVVLLTRFFSRFFKSKRPPAHTIRAQVAIIFVVNFAILTAGLLLFGHDGKMLTHAALVLGAALCQWLLLRGWKA